MITNSQIDALIELDPDVTIGDAVNYCSKDLKEQHFELKAGIIRRRASELNQRIAREEGCSALVFEFRKAQ